MNISHYDLISSQVNKCWMGGLGSWSCQWKGDVFVPFMLMLIRSEAYLCWKKYLISLEPGFSSSLLISLQLWCWKWPLEAEIEDPLSTERVISSVQSLSPVWLFATPWTAARQASLSITNPQSLLKLMSVESVMPSNCLTLCHPLLLPGSIFPSNRVFSNELVLLIRWPKDWSFSFSISPSNEYSGLISFRMDWLDLLAVQDTLKSLPQHHRFKSINSLVLSFLCSPTLTSIHDHWKNHSFD